MVRPQGMGDRDNNQFPVAPSAYLDFGNEQRLYAVGKGISQLFLIGERIRQTDDLFRSIPYADDENTAGGVGKGNHSLNDL